MFPHPSYQGFKLTEFKGYLRVVPEQPNDSFVLSDNHNFSILFSVLPGLLQHPSQKVESATTIAEQVVALLRIVAAKYCKFIESWPKDHPQYGP